MLALLAGALVVFWGRLLHDRRAAEERLRIEGIAKWLEDLRDTLRASSIGAEEALEQVASRPPAAIAGPLRTFVQRRRQGFRTEAALADLAEELAHPTSDAAIAAIRLVIGGSAGAGGCTARCTPSPRPPATRSAHASGWTAPGPSTRAA